jgi:hypothetical protein
MKPMFVAIALLLVTSGVAGADTIQVGGAEMTLPEEGWVVQEEDNHLLLARQSGGAFIEVYDFSKLPAADKATLGKLVDQRNETDGVAVTSVTPNHQQHKLRGIAFRGTATIRGKAVSFSSVALDGVGGRAVLAIAFTLPDDGAAQREATAALASLRGASAKQ